MRVFERFTDGARQVAVLAQREARELRHDHIGTEHLLLGLLAEGDGVAAGVLRDVGLDLDGARRELRQLAESGQRADDDAAALRSIGIDLDAVRAAVEAAFGPGALERARGRRRNGCGRRTTSRGQLPFTARAKKVLELSLREALRCRHDHIGTEHILLGLLREGKGLAALVLARHGLSLDDLRRRVLAALGRAA